MSQNTESRLGQWGIDSCHNSHESSKYSLAVSCTLLCPVCGCLCIMVPSVAVLIWWYTLFCPVFQGLMNVEYVGRNTSITTVSRPMCERIEVSLSPAQTFGNSTLTFMLRRHIWEGLSGSSAATACQCYQSATWPCVRIALCCCCQTQRDLCSSCILSDSTINWLHLAKLNKISEIFFMGLFLWL